MDYKKKLKIRFYTSIIYILLGIFMIAMVYFTKYDILSSLGLAYIIIGIARIRKHYRITKDKEVLRKYEIAETDERNVKIWTQARSLTFSVYVIVLCLAVILLFSLNLQREANILSANLFAFIAIYWISYYIMRKKY